MLWFAINEVRVIPDTGTLLITVPAETLDADFQHIKAEFRTLFPGRELLVVRAGDVGISVIEDKDGTTNG